MIKLTQLKHSKIITVRIPKNLDDEVSKICRELGYSSKSDFVREAVNDYINYLLSLMKDDEEALEVGTEEELLETSKVIMI